MGAAWTGRTFFIALRSPDVSAAAPAGHQAPPTYAGGLAVAPAQAAIAAQALNHGAQHTLQALGAGAAAGLSAATVKAASTEKEDASEDPRKRGVPLQLRDHNVSGNRSRAHLQLPPTPHSPKVHRLPVAALAAGALVNSTATTSQATTITATFYMPPTRTATVTTATTQPWTSVTWTSVTWTAEPTRTATTVTATTVTATTVTTNTATTLTWTSATAMLYIPSTRTFTSTTMTSTTVTTAAALPFWFPWQQTGTAGSSSPAPKEPARQAGLVLEIKGLDYQQLTKSTEDEQHEVEEGLRSAIAWRAGLERGRKVEVREMDLSPLPGAVMVRSTLTSPKGLDMQRLQSSFNSAGFQRDVADALQSSQAAGRAVAGSLSVEGITVAPILHSSVRETPLEMMGVTGWRLSEVFLFMVFVMTLCCLIPLLSRYLFQSWLSTPGSGSHPHHDDPFSSQREERFSGTPWAVRPGAGFQEASSASGSHGRDLGFASLGAPPRPRSYDWGEDSSVGDPMLARSQASSVPASPIPPHPDRLLSGSMPSSPSRLSSREQVLPSQRHGDAWPERLGHVPRLVGLDPVRPPSGEAPPSWLSSSSRLPSGASGDGHIATVVHARVLSPSLLDSPGPGVRHLDPASGSRESESQRVMSQILGEQPQRSLAQAPSRSLSGASQGNPVVQQMLRGTAPFDDQRWTGH